METFSECSDVMGFQKVEGIPVTDRSATLDVAVNMTGWPSNSSTVLSIYKETDEILARWENPW